MGKSIDKLIDLIFAKHEPYPPLTARTITQHERRIGYQLPDDLRRFYSRCNGAALFADRHYVPLRLLPLKEVKRTRIYIFGEDSSTYAPESWYAICDALDSNYIGVDLATVNESACAIIDCFHETHGIPGDDQVIALSFTEFLERTLKSKGRPYWLKKGFTSYGDALEDK